MTQEEKAYFFLLRYTKKLAATRPSTLNIPIVMQTQSTVDDIPTSGAGFSPPFPDFVSAKINNINKHCTVIQTTDSPILYIQPSFRLDQQQCTFLLKLYLSLKTFIYLYIIHLYTPLMRSSTVFSLNACEMRQLNSPASA